MRIRLKKWAVVSPRVSRWLVIAAIVAGVLFVSWLVWQVLDLTINQRHNIAQIDQLRGSVANGQVTNQRQDQALEVANQRLKEAGKPPVDVPPVPQGIPGAQGEPGAAGANGLSAYELWLAAGNRGTLAQFLFSLHGPPGPAGADGADSTVPGPVGAPGANGANGADSTVPGPAGPAGPQGPAGADGKNGADGAPGATGPQGPQGDPGRGIQSLMCGKDGRWSVTYTDGTTADAGRCRVGLLDS